MKPVVDRAQPRLEHVRVDLRRRQVGVAEHHLNGAQVGAALEQVRRERMPQHVRAERRAEAGARGRTPSESSRSRRGSSGPPRALTNSATRTPSRAPCATSAGRAVALVAPDPVGRLLADRDDALLVALADAGQVAARRGAGRRRGRRRARRRAGRSRTALDHRAVAQAARRRDVGLRRCSASTSSSERNFGSAGQARGGRRSSAGSASSAAIEHEEAVEAADRGDRRAPPSAATGPRAIVLADERFERLRDRASRAARPRAGGERAPARAGRARSSRACAPRAGARRAGDRGRRRSRSASRATSRVRDDAGDRADVG